jgi:hypothetical protein
MLREHGRALILSLVSIILIAGGCATSEKANTPRQVPAAYQPPKWQAAKKGDTFIGGCIIIDSIEKRSSSGRTFFDVIFRNTSPAEVAFSARAAFLDNAGAVHTFGQVKWETACIPPHQRAVMEFKTMPTDRPIAAVAIIVQK